MTERTSFSAYAPDILKCQRQTFLAPCNQIRVGSLSTQVRQGSSCHRSPVIGRAADTRRPCGQHRATTDGRNPAIRSRMPRHSSRGTATSPIWKTSSGRGLQPSPRSSWRWPSLRGTGSCASSSSPRAAASGSSVASPRAVRASIDEGVGTSFTTNAGRLPLDLTSGAVVWSRPLRDPAYRGSYPAR